MSSSTDPFSSIKSFSLRARPEEAAGAGAAGAGAAAALTGAAGAGAAFGWAAGPISERSLS